MKKKKLNSKVHSKIENLAILFKSNKGIFGKKVLMLIAEDLDRKKE